MDKILEMQAILIRKLQEQKDILERLEKEYDELYLQLDEKKHLLLSILGGSDETKREVI